MWWGYWGVENLGLNLTQRQTLIEELRQLGPAHNTVPQWAYMCHWKTRPDHEAAIFEAVFNESVLTIETWKNRLAAIFGVDPATIDHETIQQSFGGYNTPVITFNRGGTDYLHVALFGGVGADRNISGDEARGYLRLHAEAWGDV